jgi:hypothetical protein
MLYSGGGTGASTTSRTTFDDGTDGVYYDYDAREGVRPSRGPSSAPPYASAYPYVPAYRHAPVSPYPSTQVTSDLDDENLAKALSISLIEADAQKLARQKLEQENALLAQMSFDEANARAAEKKLEDTALANEINALRLRNQPNKVNNFDRVVGRPLVHRASSSSSSSSSYIPASAIPYSSLRDSSKYEEDEEFQKNLAIAQVASLQDSRPTTYAVAQPRYIAPGFRKKSSERPGPSSLLPYEAAPSEVPLTPDYIDHAIMSDPMLNFQLVTDTSRQNKGKKSLFRRTAGIRRSRKMRKSKRRRRKTRKTRKTRRRH